MTEPAQYDATILVFMNNTWFWGPKARDVKFDPVFTEGKVQRTKLGNLEITERDPDYLTAVNLSAVLVANDDQHQTVYEFNLLAPDTDARPEWHELVAATQVMVNQDARRRGEMAGENKWRDALRRQFPTLVEEQLYDIDGVVAHLAELVDPTPDFEEPE